MQEPSIYFVKNTERNCWVCITIDYRVTVAKTSTKQGKWGIYYEIEKFYRELNCYKTLYFEVINPEPLLSEDFTMKDLRSPFIKEIKTTTYNKIMSDLHGEEKC